MGHVARALQAAVRARGQLMAASGRRRLVAAIGLALGAALGPGVASAQSIWDDPAFQLLRQATDALNESNFAKAGELATQAIAQMPNHPLAWYVRGQAAAAQSQWDEAAAAFGKTAELYPGSFAAQRDLAASLEHVGKVKESAQAYRAALALRDQEELRVRMALMLAENGEEPTAMAELEKLAAKDSKIPAVWATLGRLSYETGELGRRGEVLRQGARPQGRRPQLVQPRRRPRPPPEPSRRPHRVRARRQAPGREEAGRHRGRSRPRGHEQPERRRPAAPDPRPVLRAHRTLTCEPSRRRGELQGDAVKQPPAPRMHAHRASQPGSRRMFASPAPPPRTPGDSACVHSAARSPSPLAAREQRLRKSVGRVLGLGLILTSGSRGRRDKDEDIPLLGLDVERPAAGVPGDGAEPLQDARTWSRTPRSRSRSSRASSCASRPSSACARRCATSSGLSLNAGEGGTQGDNLTLRGYSARNDIYLDGVRDAGSYTRDVFNLQSIEVLKGPSATHVRPGIDRRRHQPGDARRRSASGSTTCPATIGTGPAGAHHARLQPADQRAGRPAAQRPLLPGRGRRTRRGGLPALRPRAVGGDRARQLHAPDDDLPLPAREQHAGQRPAVPLRRARRREPQQLLWAARERLSEDHRSHRHRSASTTSSTST